MQRSEKILGKEGIQKLKQSKVVIIGVGGTGCLTAELLARQQVNLFLIDRDIVEESNLERQTVFSKEDVEKPKVAAAKDRLEQFTTVETLFADINRNTINKIKEYDPDLIIDCTDNIWTRLLINDFCRKENIPWIFSASVGELATLAFIDNNLPCYYCLQGEQHGESCQVAGVLNSSVCLTSSLITQMATKFLVFDERPAELLRFSLKNYSFLKLKRKSNAECPCCKGEYKYLSGEKGRTVLKLCGNNTFAVQLDNEISLKEIKEKHPDAKFTHESVLKLQNLVVFSHGRIIIHAESEKEAKKRIDEVLGF